MTALIIIDMLNDFVTGDLKCERAGRIIPNIRALLTEAHRTGAAVVYSNDAHRPEGDGEFAIWGPHAIAGTPGAQVIAELTPDSRDYIVPKRRYSSFHGTDLELFLIEQKVDTVILTGLHTNICVRHTAADAFYKGYRLVIPEDGVDAFSEKDHVEGLEYLKRVYGAEIKPTKEAVKDF